MHPVWIIYVVFMSIAIPFAALELWRVTRRDYQHWTAELADIGRALNEMKVSDDAEQAKKDAEELFEPFVKGCEGPQL